MLRSRKLMAFVPAGDLKRARRFYEKKLGLTCQGQDQFAVVFDAKGIMLRVAAVPNHAPAGFTILGWEVPDAGRAVTDLKKKGILPQKYGMPGQDERGIWTSPSGAKVVWFKDCEGNVLSLTEFPRGHRG